MPADGAGQELYISTGLGSPGGAALEATCQGRAESPEGASGSPRVTEWGWGLQRETPLVFLPTPTVWRPTEHGAHSSGLTAWAAWSGKAAPCPWQGPIAPTCGGLCCQWQLSFGKYVTWKLGMHPGWGVGK